MNAQLYLMRDKRVLPLFVVQFFGAFNDNVLKTCLTFLITYKAISISFLNPTLLINLALGLFVLPFILFAGIAGQIADKYDKTDIIRIVKISEFFIIL